MSPNPNFTESPIPMIPTKTHDVAQCTTVDNNHHAKIKANRQSNHQSNSQTETETETDKTDTYSETYFDALYSDNTDPWQYQTRWYEKRKRDICLATLPQDQYDQAIELGCGNGVFSELIAQRCQALLSIDGNDNAVQLAKQRLEGVSHVKVLQGVIPHALYSLEAALLEAYPDTCLDPCLDTYLDTYSDAFPIADKPSPTHSQASTHPFNPPFDLIVISEILYYLAPKDIDTVIDWIKQNLAVGGTLLCCHWRYDIDGFEMNGDSVHQRLQHAFNVINLNNELKQSEPKTTFTHQTKLAESDFLLDVWINSPHTVAMQENLV